MHIKPNKALINKLKILYILTTKQLKNNFNDIAFFENFKFESLLLKVVPMYF